MLQFCAAVNNTCLIIFVITDFTENKSSDMKCDKCEWILPSIGQLIKHKFDTHDMELIQCTECRGHYASYGAWRYHRRVCNHGNSDAMNRNTNTSTEDTAAMTSTTEIDTASGPSPKLGRLTPA